MARIKAQGTQVFAVVDGAVVRFSCPKAFSFGEDSFTKIDATCLDADTKNYERGLRDPGEGSIQIDLDDENADVFVTVGTGMVGVPFRFRVPPTIDIIKLI